MAFSTLKYKRLYVIFDPRVQEVTSFSTLKYKRLHVIFNTKLQKVMLFSTLDYKRLHINFFLSQGAMAIFARSWGHCVCYNSVHKLEAVDSQFVCCRLGLSDIRVWLHIIITQDLGDVITHSHVNYK